MRQVVLDTETTGLEVSQGHRIIEIGCVELVNRRATGKVFHRYLNPERAVDEGARAVHGLTEERLRAEPKFAEVFTEFSAFIDGAELVIHNAPFDLGFVNAEFARAGAEVRVDEMCRVLDTLVLARRMHPGQRNSLDALCKRYAVDNTQRELHGALLDAHLLADVYLAMTGGQANLTLSARADGDSDGGVDEDGGTRPPPRAGAARHVAVRLADETELQAHEGVLKLIDKASAGTTVWRKT